MQKVLLHTMNRETRDLTTQGEWETERGDHPEVGFNEQTENRIKPKLSLRTRLREQKDKVPSSGGIRCLILLSTVPRS